MCFGFEVGDLTTRGTISGNGAGITNLASGAFDSTGASDGEVLTADGVGGVAWEAGGGGSSGVFYFWEAPQADLVNSSPMTLEYSTNSNGRIIYHLEANRTTTQYADFCFQRSTGLSSNMNIIVRAFGVSSGDVFTVISQEEGGSAVTSEVVTLTTELDIDNLRTVVITNGISTSAPEYGQVCFDLTVSLTNDHDRAGNISISEVMILQSAP